MHISYKPRTSVDTSVKETMEAEPQQPIRASVPHSAHKKRRYVWGGRFFRFNLHNFRLNGGLSLRRFSVVEGAFLLMLALTTSRALGVIRQVVFNAIFGVGPEATAYYAAARLPETLFNLIAGGALVHAFVPVFHSYEKDKGEMEAWRLTSLVFNVLLVAMTLTVLLGEIFTPQFVNNILIPGGTPYVKDLTTSLTRIMLLQPLILGVGTVITAILNSRRQFLLPALALAIYNVGLIGGLLITKAYPSLGIYGPTYGTIVAVILQVLIQLPVLFRQGMRYSFTFDLQHPGLKLVMFLLLPNAMSIGVAYMGGIVATAYTSFFPDQGSLPALHNAEMLISLPVALIGQAVGQSLLPHLAAHANSGRYVRMRQMALKVMGTSLILTVPAALLLALVGKPLIQILFQHGNFDAHASDITYLALLGYASALTGLASGNLIGSGFFALKDAWTPLACNIYSFLVQWGLLVLFVQVLDKDYILLSVPLSAAVGTTTEALILCVLLLYRLNRKVKTDAGMLRLERRRLFQRQEQQLSQSPNA